MEGFAVRKFATLCSNLRCVTITRLQQSATQPKDVRELCLRNPSISVLRLCNFFPLNTAVLEAARSLIYLERFELQFSPSAEFGAIWGDAVARVFGSPVHRLLEMRLESRDSPNDLREALRRIGSSLGHLTRLEWSCSYSEW